MRITRVAAALAFGVTIARPVPSPTTEPRTAQMQVRTCPNLKCPALGSVVPSDKCQVYKRLETGWVFVRRELDPPLEGWGLDADRKYLEQPDQAQPLSHWFPQHQAVLGALSRQPYYENPALSHPKFGPRHEVEVAQGQMILGVTLASRICSGPECMAERRPFMYLAPLNHCKILVYVLARTGQEGPTGVSSGSIDFFTTEAEGGDGTVDGYPQPGDIVMYSSGPYWYGYVGTHVPVARDSARAALVQILGGPARYKRLLSKFEKLDGRQVIQ